MIPKKKLMEIRKAITTSARPVIFFDDDPDGLSSFLQFYKINPESKGIIYKKAGPLDLTFQYKVESYQPDKIFILDIAEVSQEFLDRYSNVYWLDHHGVSTLKNVKYYNPMRWSKGKDNRPVSYWAYKVADHDLWIALVGCIGDWYYPKDLIKKFNNPDLIPPKIVTPEDALFKTKLGKLARIFSFVLKGDTKDSMTCAKVLTRINDPYDILEQRNEQGKYIWKKFLLIDKIYQDIKKTVKVNHDKILLYLYTDNMMSLTSDLSNELLYEHPDKFILIARQKSGEMKCSLRAYKYPVLHILNKALENVKGYGGGHLHACGASIAEQDFDLFVNNIISQL